MLNDSGQPLITLEYLDFYDMCGRRQEEATDKFYNELYAVGLTKGIVIGGGDNVMCITHDKPYVP